jgi:hypothetical protein
MKSVNAPFLRDADDHRCLGVHTADLETDRFTNKNLRRLLRWVHHFATPVLAQSSTNVHPD